MGRGTIGLPKGEKEWEFIQDRSSYMCYAKIKNTCKINLCWVVKNYLLVWLFVFVNVILKVCHLSFFKTLLMSIFMGVYVGQLKVGRGTIGLPKGEKEWEFIQDRSSYMCYAKIKNTCKINLCWVVKNYLLVWLFVFVNVILKVCHLSFFKTLLMSIFMGGYVGQLMENSII